MSKSTFNTDGLWSVKVTCDGSWGYVQMPNGPLVCSFEAAARVMRALRAADTTRGYSVSVAPSAPRRRKVRQ